MFKHDPHMEALLNAYRKLESDKRPITVESLFAIVKDSGITQAQVIEFFHKLKRGGAIP